SPADSIRMRHALKLRYVILLILLSLIALIEARQPFPSFRLASFNLAFLALAVSASLLRSTLRDGFIVLASLAFGLSIVEAAAILLDRQGGPPSRMAGRCHSLSSAGDLNMRDPSMPKNQIRNPALRFTKPITQSIRICCARPARPRLAQRSLFSAIPSLSEKG